MTYRHRTFWIIRRRFRRAQWLTALVGAGLIAWRTLPVLPREVSLVASLAGAMLLWFLVGAIWRAYRRRHHDEWAQPATGGLAVFPVRPQRSPAPEPELAGTAPVAPGRRYELAAAIAGETSRPS